MDPKLIIVMVLGIALVCFGFFVYFFVFREKPSTGLSLGDSKNFSSTASGREYLRNDKSGQRYEELKKLQRSTFKKKKKGKKVENLYWQAGIYDDKSVKKYEMMKIIAPCIFAPLFAFGVYAATSNLMYGVAAGILGLLCGIQLPTTLVRRKAEKRAEDIMYYLPLVIEQIAIGVSSSLDIGPCLQYVVQMADQRDKHNSVTELVRRVQYMIRSGASMEEALVEIGTNSGHNELKHTFVALSQVSKHGGEISKQLMELARAVNQIRENKVDAKIKKLELEATGPVALVFLGFIMILLIGIFIRIKTGLV